MPFPGSFETVVVVEPQRPDRLTAETVAAYLEHALTGADWSVSNSDGTYFEFDRRMAPVVTSLIRGGAIRTTPVGAAVEVRAEVNIRYAPGLMAVLAFTLFPVLIGDRPMDGALSFLISGGITQFIYYKAVVGFYRYVNELCRHIPFAKHGPGSTRDSR
jgi:hypothetical protein